MLSFARKVLGVGAVMGDGVLTPAVSVVSAVEGLKLAASGISQGEKSKALRHRPADRWGLFCWVLHTHLLKSDGLMGHTLWFGNSYECMYDW
jgi:K+ potassium transporter